MRIQDCKKELHNLLLEDVSTIGYSFHLRDSRFPRGWLAPRFLFSQISRTYKDR